MKSHRQFRPILYGVWSNMKYRCDNANYRFFKDYGGRGIRYSKRWAKYANFIADMGPSYRSGLHLDRINNNGPYCASNCRWATQAENNNNKRTTRRITFNGETRTQSEWADLKGIKRTTLHMRLHKYGWSIERALTN